MGLFSFLNKDKQDGASDRPAYKSRAEEDSKAIRGRGKERKSRASNAPADDPLLPEKKRARRRLLGAVALVIAVVIGLPMALDPEPKPLADDIVIQIPSRDKPLPARAPAPPSIAASLDHEEEIVATDKPALPAARAAAASEQDAEPVAPRPAKPAAKPATAAAPDVDEAARAKAILEARPLEAKTDSKTASAKPQADGRSGKVILQVAALATQEKVNEVQSKLKSNGINSYTQKINTGSGERTRIRIIAANQEEAERLRAKLARLSLSGTVITPGH